MQRVGLIIPSVNTVVEDEMISFLQQSVRPHVTRLRMTGPYRKPLDQVLEQIHEAAAALVDAGCELVVFHCTANSTENGAAGEEAILSTITKAGAPKASSTATSLRRALAALGGRTLALVTPYTQAVTDHETCYLREVGQTVVYARGYDVGRAQYARMPQDFWMRGLIEASASKPDIYFLSCANVSAMSAIAPAERALGRPVITSNQIVVWDAIRELTGNTAGRGPGALFETGMR
jgi:maleate isomerase